MNNFLELNLISRIQSLLIIMKDQGAKAPAHMLWLAVGLIEAGFRVGHLTESEHLEFERIAGELMAFSGGEA